MPAISQRDSNCNQKCSHKTFVIHNFAHLDLVTQRCSRQQQSLQNVAMFEYNDCIPRTNCCSKLFFAVYVVGEGSSVDGLTPVWNRTDGMSRVTGYQKVVVPLNNALQNIDVRVLKNLVTKIF